MVVFGSQVLGVWMKAQQLGVSARRICTNVSTPLGVDGMLTNTNVYEIFGHRKQNVDCIRMSPDATVLRHVDGTPKSASV